MLMLRRAACVILAGIGFLSTTEWFALSLQAAEPMRLTDQALEIHRQSVVVDGHNNLLMRLRNGSNSGPNFENVRLDREQSALHTDIPKLIRGGVGVEFFATYVPTSSGKRGTAIRETLEQIDQIHQLAERYADVFEVALSASDIQRIQSNGKVAIVVTVEGGNTIENSLPVLRTYHQAGVRCLAITHDDTTDWADAALDKAKHGGLAKFGEQVIAEMNRLGMVIDLSHSSEATIKKALEVSTAPVLLSHSGSYKLAPYPRNVSDDTLRLIARNGGVVMVNFYAGFLTAECVKVYERRTKAAAELRKSFKTEEQFQVAVAALLKEHPLPTTTVKDVVDHIDHIVKVAGIDHVGLGSNFDGVVSLPQHLENVSCFPFVTQELLNRGYTKEQIQKVLGGNALRVLGTVESVAKNIKAGRNASATVATSLEQ